jgi:hypothetical protein
VNKEGAPTAWTRPGVVLEEFDEDLLHHVLYFLAQVASGGGTHAPTAQHLGDAPLDGGGQLRDQHALRLDTSRKGSLDDLLRQVGHPASRIRYFLR